MQSKSFYSTSHFFCYNFLYISICFHPPLFYNIEFFLQLVWIIIRKLHDNVYSFEKEKTILTFMGFILR